MMSEQIEYVLSTRECNMVIPFQRYHLSLKLAHNGVNNVHICRRHLVRSYNSLR